MPVSNFGAIVGDIAGSRFEFCNLKSGVMVVVMMLAASMALADDVNYKDVKSAEAALLPATPSTFFDSRRVIKED